MDLPVPSVAGVHGLLLALKKNLECPICLDVMTEPALTNCGHTYCKFCVLKLLTLKKGAIKCPLCNVKVTKRSLRDDIFLKEVIKGILETIHAFERDTGLKFSDDLCYPTKVMETVAASSTCKEQLIINSKGYRTRSKCMKKGEERNAELQGDNPILPQCDGNETRYFLRKRINSSKTNVLEINKEHRSVSSEDISKEGDIVSCMDFESPSSSQVANNYTMNLSHIEHPETNDKHKPSLNIDICGALEERKQGSRDDTKTVNENLEIVEGNVTVKQQQDVPYLDSCMEQPGFSCLQDDRSSSFCRMTQEHLASEAMHISTNEQIDNGEKTLTDQSAGNLSVVCENKECQLQSQAMPDVCLSKSSRGEMIQKMNKVNEWLSKNKEILSSNSLADGCSEELQDPDTDSSDSEICLPLRRVSTQTRMAIFDLNDFVKRQEVKASNKELVRKRDDPIVENSDQAFAVKKCPAEQSEAAFSKITCVEEAVSILKGDGDKKAQSECHVLPELNLTEIKNKSSYLNKRSKKLIKPLGKLQVLNKSPMLSEETKEKLDIKELRKMNQGQKRVKCNKEIQLFTEKARKQSGPTKRKINVNERDDSKTVNENLEIVEGNVTVKQQQNVSYLDSCMEQPGFSCLQYDRSSSFCRMTQEHLASEAMHISTNEQIDNGEKTLTDQSAGNLSVVCENKEWQLQSQAMPDVCLSKSSRGEMIQKMNKVNEWLSKNKEILSSNSLADGCSEELQDPDTDSSDSEICLPLRRVSTQKRMAIFDLNDFVKRQEVKASNKELVRKRDDPIVENSDQALAVVKKCPAEQSEVAFSKITCVKEAVSRLKGDGDKKAQSECHVLPELNLTEIKNKSSYLNKRSKKLLGKLQVLNKSPMLSEETKEKLDIKELRKMNQGQKRVKCNKEIQLFTKKARKQSEPTKRKINVNERELKQSISLSEIMPSSSVTEDDTCILQENPKKAMFCSDTSMIDNLCLCNRDMAYANHEKFPHVIGTLKDILNTEETAENHNADSQYRSSCLQFPPGKVEQAVSKDKQVMMNQFEKYAIRSGIRQCDKICTDNCKSPETNNKAKESCELNLETEESELDTEFMQNIFGCCKRQSFLLCSSQVKELAGDIKYLHGLSPDKSDKDGTREEKCDVYCHVNRSTSIQTPTFSTSSFSEHKNESLQFASKVPFPDCPSISLQSVTRNEDDGCQPQSKKTMDEQKQSPGLEKKTESPDDCVRSLNVWKNSNLDDTSFSHINSSSSGSVHFQEAKSKDTENKKMELNSQKELMRQHYLNSVPLLLEFINVQKIIPMEEKQLNSHTEKAVDVSSTGVIPQLNLECSAKEHQLSELLSETPDNLLDPPTKNKKSLPNLWDTNDIMPAKIDKQITNGTDLNSKNKLSLNSKSKSTLKSQDFVLTYQKLLQKLPSSEENPSENEKLPCFQELINMQSTQSHPVKEKKIPVEVLASKRSRRSCFKDKKEDICQSQESEFSVNLFSSQSNISVVSGKACNSEDLIPFSNSKEKMSSLSGNNEDISPSDKVSTDAEQLKCGQEECAHSESNLGEEMMPYDSEATLLEDSLGQFSQSEILTTQQRGAMQNNLKQLQQKMAFIEAVLKEGSQNVGSEEWSLEREQTETRKEMHSVLEKSVSPLAHTTCCSTNKRKRKSLLLTGRQQMSLVASGLNQSELKLVRKFAKKTKSTWCSKMTEHTTHLIMKTDEDLVCERTLKYFIGIAARKWVLSYQWIIHSLEAGRVLKEEDFEVRGDIVNGRNHQGPKRARESPVGKLFQGLEICCYGPFTDMLPEQLEWIVQLCGASLVKQPHLFTHATDTTAVIVVQPDAWTEETTCQALPLQCSTAVVSREWVMDSVACYRCQPFNDYILSQEPPSMSE